MADLVLIPTRASPLDIEAVRIIDELCERHRKAHAYIINAGRVLASGRPNEIVDNESVRKVYLGEHFKL